MSLYVGGTFVAPSDWCFASSGWFVAPSDWCIASSGWFVAPAMSKESLELSSYNIQLP